MNIFVSYVQRLRKFCYSIAQLIKWYLFVNMLPNRKYPVEQPLGITFVVCKKNKWLVQFRRQDGGRAAAPDT
jgi:hypothetical protein